MRLLSLFAASAMLLLSQSAAAVVMTFTDRATFEVELGTIIIDDYSDPGYSFTQSDVVMSGVLGETDYTSTGFSNQNIVFDDGIYCAGCNGSFELGFTTTSVGDTTGVFGVGFEFFNAVSPLYVAFVTFGNGTTTNIALPFELFSPPLDVFFGITADQLITSIHFGLADGGTTTGGSFGIDNLTIGNAAPEPTTLALLGLGLVGLGFARGRLH